MLRHVSVFLRRCVAAVALVAAPFAAAHGDGMTGGELIADHDGTSVTLVLSRQALLASGMLPQTFGPVDELFDAAGKPVPALVEGERTSLVFRVGEKQLPAAVEAMKDETDPLGFAVRFRWSPPPGSRSFSIERRDPGGISAGLATWAFSQTLEDGTPGESHFAQTVYGHRATFPLVTKAVPGAAPEPEAPPTETASLSIAMLLWMGFRHIIPEGSDHVLFMLSLFLPVPRLKPLTAQATAFTLAHSITLGLAMSGIVMLPSRAVEIVIAASILVMALADLKTKKVGPWRWALVFVFGLVHGLGFAGSFSQLKATPGDFGRTLFFLNVGIELAQLAVLVVLVLMVRRIRDRPWYHARVVIPVSLIVAGISGWMVVSRIAG